MPPPTPIATPKEVPVDTSPVAEPPGLVLVARVNRPDALVAAAKSWTQLPLPPGKELARSILGDAVGDLVDTSQPIDGALSIGLSRRGPDPLAALSIPVKSFENAKAKLGATYKLVDGDNGLLRIQGFNPGKSSGHDRSDSSEGAEDDDDGKEGCVLAPSPQGGRIVCGELQAVWKLAPYMSRTMPREKWASDIHVELRPEPVRAPLQELRGIIPGLARGAFGGGSGAMRDLLDASIGEIVDVVDDAQKLTIDAEVADSGVVATTRFEFQSNKSLVAQALTGARGDSAPPAFWHLPGDSDTALFGRGADPKLYDHARELLSNVVMEFADSSGMPAPERKALKEQIVDRGFSLFAGGTRVYAKGYDAAALARSIQAVRGPRPQDRTAKFETTRALVEQVVGWHLYQVSEPVAKVGPVLKDMTTLWNRPAFAKWVQAKASPKSLPKMRLAPVPAGVTLPRDTVHLELVFPVDTSEPTGKRGAAKPAPTKSVGFHVFAVPDGGATWLAFGMDAKLVAQKAAASLASASDANTLGKVAGTEALREAKIQGGGFVTVRGFAVFAALAAIDEPSERSPFGLLASLPHEGKTPMIVTGRAEPPSPAAKAGAATGSFRVSRAVIEDIVKLAMAAH